MPSCCSSCESCVCSLHVNTHRLRLLQHKYGTGGNELWHVIFQMVDAGPEAGKDTIWKWQMAKEECGLEPCCCVVQCHLLRLLFAALDFAGSPFQLTLGGLLARGVLRCNFDVPPE